MKSYNIVIITLYFFLCSLVLGAWRGWGEQNGVGIEVFPQHETFSSFRPTLLMICLHFHSGAQQLKYVCMVRFSFLSFFPTYAQNLTQHNVPRVREREGGKIPVPRERPPIQSLSSSGFDASSILMSNQVFFYDCL